MAARRPAKSAGAKRSNEPSPKKAPTKKARANVAARRPSPPPPRADKGTGEAAVQARIKALAEPARSILTKLHPLVVKHGDGLEPSVKWGFAVYSRGGKMLLVAAPRKAYVSFGFTTDAEKSGVGKGYVEYRSPDDVKEAQVATWAMLAAAAGGA